MNTQDLKFARQHDWGRKAYLTEDGQIAGLVEVATYTYNDEVTVTEYSVATRREMLDRAGY